MKLIFCREKVPTVVSVWEGEPEPGTWLWQFRHLQVGEKKLDEKHGFLTAVRVC